MTHSIPLTDSVDGTLADKQDFLENEIISFEERVEDIDSNLAIRRQRMEAEFLAMEKIMAEFQGQEQFLAGQIEAFSNMAAARSGRK